MAGVQSTTNGALGLGDRGANQVVSYTTFHPFNTNDFVTRWRQLYTLYETSWEARKIVRIPVEDALRKPWEIENIPEEIANAIAIRHEQLRLIPILKRSLILERLFGGCLTFMGLEDQIRDEVSNPYSPRIGAPLRFINAIPISRISRITWCSDPLSEHYQRPEKYLVNGQDVHVSRCLVWDGEPLVDAMDFAITLFRVNLAGFGPSVLYSVWDDIIKAIGTRQAAYQLIQVNNAIIAAIDDLQSLESTTPGKATIAKIQNLVNQLSVYRAAIVNGEDVKITQNAASFGSVPELLLLFLQVLAAGSDIPATRFIGQAPGGLNSTGESDLENYYNMIDAYQRQRIEPNLRRMYDVTGYELFPESWGKLRMKLRFKFPPLWNMDELKEAQVAGQRIDNAIKAYDAGACGLEKVVEELNAKNAFSNKLDEDDIDVLRTQENDPVNAEEEISKLKSQVQVPKNTPIGEVKSQVKNADFKESEHPRANDGKFGTKSGPKKSPDKKADAEKKFQEAQSQRTPHDREAFQKAKDKGIRIPPAWTSVWISDEKKPANGVIAKGLDSQHRVQVVEYPGYRENKIREKHARIRKKLIPTLPAKEKKIQAALNTEEGKVLYLISKMAFRVGSDADTKAKKPAFGATTLKGSHITIKGSTAVFDFPGKKGVQQHHETNDPTIVKMVKDKAGKDVPVFQTDAHKVLSKWKSMGGDKVHDWRSVIATQIAQDQIKKINPPSNDKEFKKAAMKVAEVVAAKLGNRPAESFATYIDPAVFDAWRK